jgi:hypothetical protein
MPDNLRTPVTISVKETRSPKAGTSLSKTATIKDIKAGTALAKLAYIKDAKVGISLSKIVAPASIK